MPNRETPFMSTSAADAKRCKWCAETIHAAAIVCPRCHRELTPRRRRAVVHWTFVAMAAVGAIVFVLNEVATFVADKEEGQKARMVVEALEKEKILTARSCRDERAEINPRVWEGFSDDQRERLLRTLSSFCRDSSGSGKIALYDVYSNTRKLASFDGKQMSR